MKKIIHRMSLTLFVLSFSLLLACTSERSFDYQLHGATMGTTYNVTLVFPRKVDIQKINEIKTAVQASLNKVDNAMSTYKEQSELSKINNLPLNTPYQLSNEIEYVLSYAKALYGKTDGLFDITIGPLVDIWGFGVSDSIYKAPKQDDLDEVAQGIGSNHFKIESGAISKKSPVKIDLSAIAKGYAVDQVEATLDKLSIQNYLIEVGGEISAKGKSPSRDFWVLGIEAPDSLKRKAFTRIRLSDASLATSGDYRNYFESNGRRYSHTLNPKTNYPVTHNLASVSVVAETCMEADALATALMVMGEQKGFEYAKQNAISAYFIYRDDQEFRFRSTLGFKQYFVESVNK